MWFRVDNRLIHGQVIEGWMPYTGARHLVVVNDELAGDFLRQQIMTLAVSRHIQVHFVRLEDLPRTLSQCGPDTFVLFEIVFQKIFSIPSGSSSPIGVSVPSFSSLTPRSIVPPYVFANAEYVSHMLLGRPFAALFASNVVLSLSFSIVVSIVHLL